MKRTFFRFDDDGTFPNNQEYDVVIHSGLNVTDPEQAKEILYQHGWRGAWTNGIFDFPHYHSTAHEVLECIRGEAEVRLGGGTGQTVTIRAGDAVLLPAGTAHQRLSSTSDFQVVGAYPKGQSYDMMYGNLEERPQADQRIKNLPPPPSNPFSFS